MPHHTYTMLKINGGWPDYIIVIKIQTKIIPEKDVLENRRPLIIDMDIVEYDIVISLL